MKDNFDACLHAVLAWEGGKVNNPHDNGGKTNQGITQRVYDAWRLAHNLGKRDVYMIASNERDAIYRVQYWDAVDGDNLPRGLDLMAFDAAVLSGPVQAIKWLQRALLPAYTGAIDGQMGVATRQALRLCNPPVVIGLMGERRLAFFRQLSSWTYFGIGWTRRVHSIQQQSMEMTGAGGKVATVAPSPVTPTTEASAKAPIDNAAPRPTKSIGDVATGGGIAVGTAAAAVESARSSLSTLAAGNNEFVTKVVVVLTLLGLVLTFGGLAWRWLQKRREAERANALDLPSAAAEIRGQA